MKNNLSAGGFPEGNILLRDWLTEWSIENFKIKNMERVMNLYPTRKFIVIFDNSNPSLELAKTISEKYPGKVLQVYLRMTVQKEIPATAKAFFSAFDIAESEWKASRFEKSEVLRVAAAILAEKDAEKLIPAYAFCPMQIPGCDQSESEIQNACNGVRMKIISICRSRGR